MLLPYHRCARAFRPSRPIVLPSFGPTVLPSSRPSLLSHLTSSRTPLVLPGRAVEQ
jgi:hypothetical protein